MDRNVAMVEVSLDAIASFIREGERVVEVESCVPEDAKPVNAYYSHARACFLVVFSHESFELVPEGTLIPTLDPPQITEHELSD